MGNSRSCHYCTACLKRDSDITKEVAIQGVYGSIVKSGTAKTVAAVARTTALLYAPGNIIATHALVQLMITNL